MKIISFPHLGEYHYPIEFFLKKVLNKNKIMSSPPITKKTLELGAKYSPDFVCVPFKYNLGNYIETLENGANVLLQAGGGCRFAYYGEVQEKILRDLGYEFEFISFAGKNCTITPFSIYKALKKINNRMSLFKYIYYLLLSMLMVLFMDKIDIFIRKNIGFEIEENVFIKTKKEMINKFLQTKGFICLLRNYYKYKKIFKNIPVNKDENVLKVAIIGELYTSIETFASYNIEYELAKMNVEVTRCTNLTYLLLTKKLNFKKTLLKSKKYLKYHIGADGTDNVARTIYFAENNYDGIIHTKPFGCTPEVGAIPIISKVADDLEIPIIFLTFDSQTSIEGVKTRLEAFYDMIKRKKEIK